MLSVFVALLDCVVCRVVFGVVLCVFDVFFVPFLGLSLCLTLDFGDFLRKKQTSKARSVFVLCEYRLIFQA